MIDPIPRVDTDQIAAEYVQGNFDDLNKYETTAYRA